ncbi:MAG TPA: type II toxin-antitoxin system death-on-curing family toxin [bacterium]|nr:type II toxin-antitoxin system death-on-curing family toxin [bacterium]HQI05828.1 type II toxin-antitoxin system death-on-curing family toxin [bacterium]HQN71881.1 type II toxin-antitoxin system death-on-curing family toxin [bacterium]
MPFNYITLEQALDIHSKTVDISGGGEKGVLDKGRLESVLEHIQNDDYYPEFIDKITHLFFCANKFHCFVDGNKRISISLSAQFLLINGYYFCVSKFIKEMENISYHLAAGKISKELLMEIILSVINGDIDENEELKIKILNSIQD